MLSDEQLARSWHAFLGACRSALKRTGSVLSRPAFQRVFLPEPGGAASDRTFHCAVRAVLCLLVCSLLLGRMVQVGLERGMDGDMYEAVDDAGHALAIAISDMRYGLHRGYVGYRVVFDALEKGGITKKEALVKALGRTYPEQLTDRTLVNQAIQSALHTVVPSDVSFADRSLISMETAEIGLVDYYKLSFRLFGFQVESAFYLYFVLLGISVAAFILAHWRSRAALVVPILFLAAGNIVLDTGLLDQINSQTVVNPRFVSTLGLLPGFHILLMMLDGRRPTVPQIVLACGQATIFEFVFSIRATLLWLVVFIAAIAIVQIAIAFARRNMAGGSAGMSVGSLSKQLVAARLWPVMVLVLGVWTYQTALAAKMHPSYELEDFVPYHLRYHNALLGLSLHPQWQQLFGKDYYGTQGDTLGFVAGVLYLMDNYDVPESYYLSPLSATYMMRLDDRMKRNAYFQFIRRHPWFVVEAHFYKAKALVLILADYARRALAVPNTALIGMGALVVGFLLGGSFSFRTFVDDPVVAGAWQIAVISALVALFAWLPFIYASPIAYAVADPLWTLFFALLVVSWAALMALSTSASRALAREAK
jgi:hypothetical protein